MALTKKGIVYTIGAMSMLFIGTVGVSAYQEMVDEYRLDKARQEEDRLLIANEKAKQEALALKYSATKREYIDYAYNSETISSMLRSKKYNSDEKMVFFTFDNILSDEIASTIVESFEEYDAKGTFFYTGSQVENKKDEASLVIEKLYNNGNSIGNRSYSDVYTKLFPNKKINAENFLNEYSKTDEVLKSILGESFKTRAYRCPGGSMSWKGIDDFIEEYSESESFGIIDWNVAPSASGKSGADIAKKAIDSAGDKDIVVILVPKLTNDKMADFLNETLSYFNEEGYTFKSLG
jgi:peptidoglycan/xylan/chitin deacetylase (PgdA/CDA1 family)